MSLLSSIGKGITGAIGGFVTGGPAGAVAGGAMGLFGGPGGGRPPAPPAIFNAPTAGNTGITLGGGLSIPGLGGIGGGVAVGWTGSGGAVAPQGGGCPRGYHLNKHALPASKRHGAVAARTLCVRNRHVNALNGRAAGRALRRLKRADKMTRKIHSLFHHRTVHSAKKR